MTDELITKMASLLEKNTLILDRMTRKENDPWRFKHDVATADSTYTPLHGDGGVFAGPGLDRDVISAHVRPRGIGALLKPMPSIDLNPRFGALTGYTGPIGSQPTNACDPAPTAYVKGCNLSALFGRIRYDTQTIEIDDVMMRVNRGDFTDLMLRGKILQGDIGPANVQDTGQVLNIVTLSEMVNVGVQFERELGRQIWQGVTTVANEFPGLDAQIATGQQDADTGTLCPALDSDVKNFNYRLIDETIVNYISMLEYYLWNNADRMGLMPVSWVLAMRPQLFFELSAIWPCAYNTYRCEGVTGTNGRANVDGKEMVAARDAMRQGMYLDVNGRRYPVVVDDGIFEHNSINNGNLIPGEYASSIYMVPLTITGNFPVTYRQYKDYSKAGADIAFLRGKELFWTDGGAYFWTLNQTRFCYDLSAKTEQRIVLRTPQLAGRIDAIKYSPLQHLRDSDPDSAYFADGGVSVRGGLSLPYAPWSGR